MIASIESALADLESELAAPYYDERADVRDRDAYYAELSFGDDPRANYDALQRLLERTHHTRPAYRPHAHLYPIDLHPDGRLRSLYTGDEYDAEELIHRGFAVEAERRNAMRQIEASRPLVAADLEAFERRFPYDAEHSTCQSWFDAREPMRGDVHALFTCEHKCNSFRSNWPYRDFPDYLNIVRERCGRREPDGFEPADGKGPASRGVLYFLARYHGEFGARSPVDAAMIDVLRRWHGEHPVTEYELHRNASIAARQGNRNPFIDHPDWIDRVDLVSSL